MGRQKLNGLLTMSEVCQNWKALYLHHMNDIIERPFIFVRGMSVCHNLKTYCLPTYVIGRCVTIIEYKWPNRKILFFLRKKDSRWTLLIPTNNVFSINVKTNINGKMSSRRDMEGKLNWSFIKMLIKLCPQSKHRIFDPRDRLKGSQSVKASHSGNLKAIPSL